jgi:rhodanese-related sulfurtransferase
VDAATALSLAASGARVVDVRTPEEFAEGHLPGAVNVPYDEIERRVSEVGPKDGPVLLYCRSGRRSRIAAEALRELGYSKVYDAQRWDALAEASKGG